MVHQELSVIHAGKDFHVRSREDSLQMFGLRPGYEGFFRTVPVMDVRAVYGFQLVVIDILVAVPDGFAFALRPDLPALVQQRFGIHQ